MQTLTEKLRRFRDDRNWSRYLTPKNVAEAVSIEAAELLQHFQWRDGGEDLTPEQKKAVAEEAADVLIYTLILFDELDMDPTEETQKKISLNEKRYPVSGNYETVDDLHEWRHRARRATR